MCGNVRIGSFRLAFARIEIFVAEVFGGRGLWRIMADCGGGAAANIIH